MEPVLRLFCARFRQLPTLVTRSLRNFKASARFIRLKPQIAGFRITKDVPVLRVDHVPLERILHRVREIASRGVPMVKDATEQKETAYEYWYFQISGQPILEGAV
jgi:hypothetical protein